MTKETELQTTEIGLSAQSTFLPEGYKVPDNSNQFMKLEPGDNIIRILSQPLIGYVFFTNENKPVRSPYNAESNTFGDFTREELERYQAKKRDDGNFEGSRHFWMLLVWEYKTDSPKVLEITQKDIIRSINGFWHDKDWGDPRKFDIVINRVGTGRTDTKYTVKPKPHSKAADQIVEFVLAVKDDPGIVQLNRIWKGEYPFEAYNW